MDMEVVGLNSSGKIPGHRPVYWNTAQTCRSGVTVLTADDRLRHSRHERRNPDPADEPQDPDRKPGSAAQTGCAHQPDQPARNLEQAPGGWCDGAGAGQPLLHPGESSFSTSQVGLLDTHKASLGDLWKGQDVADLKTDNKYFIMPHDSSVFKIS
jgi:hypothetical protein